MNINSRYLVPVVCATLFGATSLATPFVTPLSAQQDLGRDGTSWRWDGAMPSGSSVQLFNINGALRFTPSPDGSVHVQAEKHVHSGGDPRSVHYAVVRDGNSLTICALWNDDATCESRGMRGHRNDGDEGSNDRRHNVAVEFAVQIPAGVRTNGNTINGEVSVERVGSDVRASTVNGTVRVTQVTGSVRARTVNGDIIVETRGAAITAETVNGSVRAVVGNQGTGDLRFGTVSGDIDISAPSPLNAEVELSTVSGSVESKYPLDFDRDRHRARGVIGNDGRQLRARTVSGSITLH